MFNTFSTQKVKISVKNFVDLLYFWLADSIIFTVSHLSHKRNSLLIDRFRYIKFSLAVRLREHKQRKLHDHVFSFLLFVSSRPHHQAEFQYIESGVFQRYCYLNFIVLLLEIRTFKHVHSPLQNGLLMRSIFRGLWYSLARQPKRALTASSSDKNNDSRASCAVRKRFLTVVDVVTENFK